jgi:hypothetical protein
LSPKSYLAGEQGRRDMRAFIVEAKSLESACSLSGALAQFNAELSGSDEEGYRVTIDVGSSDQQVIAVLNAIEAYFSERRDGPTLVELDGRHYTLHAERD